MNDMSEFPRFLHAGEHALLIELGEVISPHVNKKTTNLAQTLLRTLPLGATAVIPGYCSVLIEYDPLQTDAAALKQHVRQQLDSLDSTSSIRRRWHIPVAYGGEYGIDLEFVAQTHGISTEEVIYRHSSPIYRVYMVGFLPGLAYLGELDPLLHTPRRATPRTITPAGSINLGGAQTLIASVPGPSGWHLLGRTPVQVFNLNRPTVFMLNQGDEILFQPIAHSDFYRLANALSAHQGMPEPEVLI
ncbi:5-oxoprolinase subunit PxpB [Paenalcaligenes niemegkensis]|uniref:5-oxoprolinase subunit PxpB n=1 Tax=Paenalcaligenes niemegkensis TaxID=2895469 RepID=UPI001EE94EEC|nr:5-oxoprolinase subunit PxpB [Paenalcaligenes niemegkensis]MCQ9618050.1 5-oxoprolinase subunit PxpB [Paenalcaligenes niemegkensis]